MSVADLQLDWDNTDLRSGWSNAPDLRFLIEAIDSRVVEIAAAGARGRLLEVAAAEAVHACKLAQRGLEVHVVEPSPAMMERARGHAGRFGVTLHLVRGVGEQLPYPDGCFDRILCDSAIDHFLDPAAGIAEMTRVLAPGERLIVSFVNYAGLAARVSRAIDGIERRLRPELWGEARFWDSPVPSEHTFECSPATLARLCAPGLVLESTHGISLGWNARGWSPLLRRLPPQRARRMVALADALARRVPGIADFVVTVWRRPESGRGVRPRRTPLAEIGRDVWRRATRSEVALSAVPPEWRHVDPADGVYRSRARVEERDAARFRYAAESSPGFAIGRRLGAQRVGGEAEPSWIEDLAARGPFPRVAILGCDGPGVLREWLASGAAGETTVYEPSAWVRRALRRDVPQLGRFPAVGGVLGQERERSGAGSRPAAGRVVVRSADLNFLALAPGHFDLILTCGALGRVANLEHVLATVSAALRPGGLFAVFEYVGPARYRWSEAQRRAFDRVLAEVPAEFRFGGREHVEVPARNQLSPYAALRTDEIEPLFREGFDVVVERLRGRLSPALLALDLAGIERERTGVLARLVEMEQEEDAAAGDVRVPPTVLYAVGRRRDGESVRGGGDGR